MLKKWFARIFAMMAGDAAKDDTSGAFGIDIRTLVILVLPVAPIITCSSISFFTTVSPIWNIILSLSAALVYSVVIIYASASSIIKGVKYGLSNPRKGETWIDLVDTDGEVLWSSEKFKPLPAVSGRVSIDGNTQKNMPKNHDAWVRWKNIYDFIAPLMAQGQLKKKQILARIQNDLPEEDQIANLRTLRDIEKAGRDGLLDTWEKFCEMTKTPSE